MYEFVLQTNLQVMGYEIANVMMMKVDIMTTSRETLWYEYFMWNYIGLDALLWYVDQCMISGDDTAQNWINDDKTPSNTVPLYIPL